MLDCRAVHAGDRRSRADARAHRLLQLRRGVPAQARRRDVRVRQGDVPAHLPLHEHQRPGAERGDGAAPGALGHRRGDVLDRRRVAGDVRAYRQRGRVRRRHGQPARHGGREADGGPRRALHQLALHPVQLERQRRRDGARAGSWPPTSASTGCAGRSRTIPRTRSRGGSRPARPTTQRIRHEVWDTSTSATRFPAPRRGLASMCRALLPGAAVHRAARRGRSTVRTRVHNLSARPFPRAGQLRPAPRAPGRAVVRRGRHGRDRDYARAWLPHDDLAGGEQADVPIEIPRAGPTRPLPAKFDLVSEGIDWFEACGSETTMKTLRVW